MPVIELTNRERWGLRARFFRAQFLQLLPFVLADVKGHLLANCAGVRTVTANGRVYEPGQCGG